MIVSSVSVCVLLAGCASNASPSSGADQAGAGSYSKACKAAAAKGALQWWTQDPTTSQKEIRLFNKKYPDVKVKFTYAQENTITQRLSAEANAGRSPSADLIVGYPAAFEPLVQNHQIDTKARWPREVHRSLVSSSDMVRVSRRAYGLVYNTKQFSSKQLPNTWQQLDNSRWRGKVSVHAQGVPFDILSAAWGEKRTVAWARDMVKKVNPEVINGTTDSIQSAASGDVPIAASGRDAEMREQRAAGAPIDIKYLDYVPVLDYYQAIPAGAKHVNAAVCFGTWYVTEGAKAIQKMDYSSNADKPSGLPSDARIVTASTPSQIKVSTRVLQEVSKIWANGS